MGEGCELFYEDAKKVGRRLDIALTARQPRNRSAKGHC